MPLRASEKPQERRLPQMTERELQNAVMTLAGLLGWSCYHTWLSARSTPGFPDCIFVRAGKMLAVELKSERGKLSEAQEHWLGVLGAVPGIACFVWRPDDWRNGICDRVLQ